MSSGKPFFEALIEEARASREGPEIAALRRLRRELAAAGASDVPRDLDRIATYLGVVETRSVPLSTRGRLVAERGGLVVELNQDDSPQLRRFTYAHELAHLVAEPRRAMQATASTRAASERSERAYAEIEALCNRLAGEMLMPESWLSDRVSLDTPSLADALSAAQTADVDPELVAKEAINRGLWRALLIVWAVGPASAAPLRSCPHDDPRGAPTNAVALDDASLLNSAVATPGTVVKGPIFFRAPEQHRLFAEAVALGSGVLSLMSLDP